MFHKNNELAGYCSVIHALELAGLTGDYGRRLTAVVIGFGATARGAVTALNAHGVHEVAVLTNRGVAAVGSPIHSVLIRQFDHEPDGEHLSHVITERGREPLAAYLAENDIVVNCTLQDTANPLVYLQTEDLAAFRPGSVIVDVSCDLGMGFSWARPTTFEEPTFVVGENVLYYAVDHSPSYLWSSATWENSNALIPFLRPVLEGAAAWDADETLSRAIEIRDGRVVNPAILAFQGRAIGAAVRTGLRRRRREGHSAPSRGARRRSSHRGCHLDPASQSRRVPARLCFLKRPSRWPNPSHWRRIDASLSHLEYTAIGTARPVPNIRWWCSGPLVRTRGSRPTNNRQGGGSCPRALPLRPFVPVMTGLYARRARSAFRRQSCRRY